MERTENYRPCADLAAPVAPMKVAKGSNYVVERLRITYLHAGTTCTQKLVDSIGQNCNGSWMIRWMGICMKNQEE